MINIDDVSTVKKPNDSMPIFRLGFRPFFLAGGLFAVFSMLLWTASYSLGLQLNVTSMSMNTWHAHEMLFGYTMAVVAGFLLTAIRNWTGIEVLRGKPLMLLLLLWLIARVLPFTDLAMSVYTAVIDVSFLFALTFICLRPVVMVKQYKQIAIISKLFLLMGCNLLFYLGVFGIVQHGIEWGLYSAIYMIIGLILLMMRRVMPMFISNGVDGEVEMKNRLWVDHSSLVLLLLLWITDVFTAYDQITTVLAAMLAIVHMIRLSGWYTDKIWPKPLVWILVLAYVFIIAGFILKTLEISIGLSPFLSVHAFTVGGIGLVTIGMMSRVSLGHTGRNVFEPPPAVFWIMLLITSAAIVRVILPMFVMEMYREWIAISQVLWILAFALFSFIYAPMFLAPRVDGRDG